MSNYNKFESCRVNNNKVRSFPTDPNSLYAEKIYDDQHSRNKCYRKNPIKIIENMSHGLRFEHVLQISIIVLLVLFFIFLIRDMTAYEVVKIQSGGFLDVTTSATEITAMFFDNVV